MVYKNNRYSNDETVSVLYDVHNFLEIRFLQLFSIFHKMKKHEINVILKSKTMTHRIKCVYREENMYMFEYTFAIFSTSSF